MAGLLHGKPAEQSEIPDQRKHLGSARVCSLIAAPPTKFMINLNAKIGFTLEQGLHWAKQIELYLQRVGWHCALGGSLIYKGESENDIDIIAYPHNIATPAVSLDVKKLAEALGFSTELALKCSKSGTPGRIIYKLIGHGVIIDLFVRP